MDKNQRVIFLLDLDAFFASCHVAKNPELKEKYLVVSSPNKRAIVTTASYKARSIGIKTGMPLFKAKQMCEQLYVVNSDFSLYTNYSNQVFDIITKYFTKKIEVASIDECYIDATEFYKKYKTVKNAAQAIIDKVYQLTGLTCSIGISTNKFLAKMAVDFNKPNGITIMLPTDIKKMLWPLPIKKMYMVGVATEKKLLEYNISTIENLAKADVNFLISILGKRGYTLHYWANGIASDEIELEGNELKNIGNELTLSNTTLNYEEIEEILYELSLKVADRARKRFLKAKTIAVVIKYLSDNYKNEEYDFKDRKKHITKQETILKFTNDPEIIYTIAKQCFYQLWEGEPVLLLGVRLSNLVENITLPTQLSIDQINLLETQYYNEIEKIIYDLNLKFGKNKVFTGKQLIKYSQKNKNQNKYLKNDNLHISNHDLIEKWKK